MKLLLPGGGGAGGIITGWGLRGLGAKIFFLPGGGGAGGIIRGWRLRGQGAKKIFFCQGEVVQEALSKGGG